MFGANGYGDLAFDLNHLIASAFVDWQERQGKLIVSG